MNAPARTTSDRDLALHFLEVLNTGHFEQLDDLLTEDVVIEWPQTNERIRGTANAKATFINYPGGLSNTGPDRVVYVQGDERQYLLTPMFTMVKAGGSGEFYTMVVRTTYPDGSEWYVIVMLKTREGKVAKVVNYFAPVIPAPEWRAQWVEPIEDAD